MRLSKILKHRLPKLVFSKNREKVIAASGLFSADWYLETYPDVKFENVDALTHFCLHGDKEHRYPGPQFDSVAYAKAHPELEGLGPLEHYLLKGKAAGFVAIPLIPPRALPKMSRVSTADVDSLNSLVAESGFFDAEWYGARYPDLHGQPLLEHFLTFGIKEGRDPGPQFSSALYALRYGDSIAENQSAFEHFILHGQAAGLEPPAPNSYDDWRALYDEIDASDIRGMRKHAQIAEFSPITIVHVFDNLACLNCARIVISWRNSAIPISNRIIVFSKNVENFARSRVIQTLRNETQIAILDNDYFAKAGDHAIIVAYGATFLSPYSTYLIQNSLGSGGDIVYGDFDRWTDRGIRIEPHMLPEYSPTLLQSQFYIGPIVGFAPRRFSLQMMSTIVERLKEGFGDAVIAALRQADWTGVRHIPFTLSSLHKDSELPQIRYERISNDRMPVVSILIPTRDKKEILKACIDSILEKTQYPSHLIEVVIIDNGSDTKEAKDYLLALKSRVGFKIVEDAGAFNFARLNNRGAAAASGEALILLNNDTLVIDPQWITKILVHCMQEDVGAVGCKLLYPDETIQHAGCVIGVAGLAAHRLVGRAQSEIADNDHTREMTSLTGACLGVRRDVFRKVGGMDETLRVAFNDVKFCIDCIRAGFRNVYVSDPLLYHLESKSRGFDVTPAQQSLCNREAIYTRRFAAEFFRNDPFYSPNLSQIVIDQLAFPPRRTRPWNKYKVGQSRKIMLLSVTHSFGSGVAVALKQQAEGLLRRGYDVIVAGPKGPRDFDYAGCKRIDVKDAATAAHVVVVESVDCVIVHTPPFYSIVRFLGAYPIIYFIDYGEPNPEFFENRLDRENINWEKRFCAPLAKRIFTISETVRNQSLDENVTSARIGNSHLTSWNCDSGAQRMATRGRVGWTKKFIVMNICRFNKAERNYKGIDKYVEIAKEMWFRYPDTQNQVIFCIAGHAQDSDIKMVRAEGLEVFANITDEEMGALLTASDLYMNFSKWEGYNLGIGQALAMGLPVIASDIEAHREFPIKTTNDVRVATDQLHTWFTAWQEGKDIRQAPYIEPWERWNEIVLGTLERDLEPG